MITKIQGEAPFQVLTNSFSISPSQEGYTLQISADGKSYSNLFSVGANVTRLVTGVASGSYYRLLGNNSAVSINWQRSCSDGGSGGGSGSGTALQPVTELPMDPQAGTVIALESGDTVGVYQYDGEEWIPVGVDDLSNYYTKAQVDAIESGITSALEEDEEVVSRALNDLNDRVDELSGSTSDFMTIQEAQNEFASASYVQNIADVVVPGLAAYIDSVSAATEDVKEYVDERIDGYDSSTAMTISSTPMTEGYYVYFGDGDFTGTTMGPEYQLFETNIPDVVAAELDFIPAYIGDACRLLGLSLGGFDAQMVLDLNDFVTLDDTNIGMDFHFVPGSSVTNKQALLSDINLASYPSYFIINTSTWVGHFAYELPTITSHTDGVVDYIDELAGMMQVKEQVVSRALNDLNTYIGDVDLKFDEEPLVRSDVGVGISEEYVKNISNVIAVHQDTYDQMENQGMLDPNTFYIIDNTLTPWDGR